MYRSIVALVLGASCSASPAMAVDCFAPLSTQPATSLSVVAPEMVRAPMGDLACLTAQAFLARVRAPIAAPGAYVPLTKDDNTPWRFDMRQNGKQMTSVEFDAWMKAKGIRVATGKPGANTAAGDPATAAPLPAPVETGR